MHCGDCQAVIVTTDHDEHGIERDVEIAHGFQFRVAPSPQGVAVVQIEVPLCAACRARVEAAEKQGSGKLVVPEMAKPRLVQ